MTEEKTRREQLEELMAEMREQERGAAEDMNDLFLSADMNTFIGRIEDIRGRTVPGGHYDQILGSVLNVLNSTKGMAQKSQAPAE